MRPRQRENLLRRKRSWEEAQLAPNPALPPKAAFKPKFGLPKLNNYRGQLKASYWSKWKSRKLNHKSVDKSWVSALEMRKLSERASMGRSDRLERVCERLEKGADIGVEGRGRLKTRVNNASSVFDNGYAVSDSLQEGIMDGYLTGPYTYEEVENLLGKEFSINPMNTRPKPNGKMRIIIDASAPHDQDESIPGWLWNPDLPGSSNSTIDVSKFPAKMSSVAKFVRTLYRVGREARICKIDQSSAYKHQHVRREDWCLQVLEWGGRLFIETRLMFGSKSAPGIYDDLHKAFLEPVIKITPKFSRRDVEQHLDDVLGVGPPEEDPEASVDAFFRNYKEEASRVGFRLDSSGNRDKVQPPDTVCTALGVEFNTRTWTWRYKEDKLARILNTLSEMQKGEEVEFSTLQSITGKLIDVKFLVPGGKFNILFFLQAVQQDLSKHDMVKMSKELKDQAGWWMVALKAATKYSPIVHPDCRVPSNAMEGYTDAAGGTVSKVGAGLGGLVPPHRYFYLPWPAWLNMGRPNSDGVVFASKLTCLELLGALVLLTVCADLAAGGHLRVWVDNQGAVDVFRKGHSTKCVYTSSIAKAIFEVADATGANKDTGIWIIKDMSSIWFKGVRITVEKVRRCSNRGAYTADIISKGNLKELRRMMPLREVPCMVPESIISWIKDPRKDMNWSQLILKEMQGRGIEVVYPY